VAQLTRRSADQKSTVLARSFCLNPAPTASKSKKNAATFDPGKMESLIEMAGAARAMLAGGSSGLTAEPGPLVLEIKIVLGKVKGRIDHLAVILKA
jgi:hypothetical protein